MTFASIRLTLSKSTSIFNIVGSAVDSRNDEPFSAEQVSFLVEIGVEHLRTKKARDACSQGPKI